MIKLFNVAEFVNEQIAKIRKQVGNRQVICALSGGVDSSVAAVLAQKAIGANLTCIFVDHGLLRKEESQQVTTTYVPFNMQVICVDAAKRFLDKLIGITNPEQKRKIIGNEFIAVFEEEAKKLSTKAGDFNFLLQGTIYSDVVESGKDGAKIIKTHHNVGGLPDNMNLKLLEPLRSLRKNEVREVGDFLGIAPEVVWRQPFPGPGLAIRCLGKITTHKLHMLREADAIVREVIGAYNQTLFTQSGLRNSENSIWQYFAILPNIQSVGMKNGARTYGHTIVIRAVHSTDAITADWAQIPYGILAEMSARITQEVDDVNRVVYDITPKPPSTIEWE